MRIVPALLLLTLMSSCVAPPAPPRPAPPAPRVRVARPMPSPATLPADWRDWPLTAGSWAYTHAGQRTVATFPLDGAAAVSMTCDMARRTVELAIPARPPAPITIRTSTARRDITPVLRRIGGDGSPVDATASFAATDPLLDAIAFSRGRWTIEQAGAPPLVLPAYAEVARVVEDCRG